MTTAMFVLFIFLSSSLYRFQPVSIIILSVNTTPWLLASIQAMDSGIVLRGIAATSGLGLGASIAFSPLNSTKIRGFNSGCCECSMAMVK